MRGLKEKTKEAEDIVLSYLPAEEGFQKIVLEACNYSVENGGKRLRPLMLAESYLLCSGRKDLTEEDRSVVGPFMAAMEMIHSSSLVHDDLPCMDNDTLRRGKPSTWAKYGEDMGTLAGDGLMIYAFETACKSAAAPELKCRALQILAEKTGIFGMIGGQTVDVYLTGKRPTAEQLDFIYRLKTGALLEASFMMGAVLAGAEEAQVEKLREAALSVGMAFQIRDDILDVTSDEKTLGKPIHSDSENEKFTWLDAYGMEQSLRDVERYSKQAVGIVSEWDENSFLKELILMLVDRKR